MGRAHGRIILTLLLGCLGCGGGNDSDSGAGGTGSGGGGSYALGSLDEKCDETGPSANDVLAFSEPQYTLTLAYVDTSVPSTTLTLAIAYSNGALTCHRHISPPPGSAAPEVPPRVEVVVQVQ